MKRLIVNADDFGMTPGVNRAVLKAHRAGIVTSTTLMATGAATEEAIRLATGTENLHVGCHVVLLEGRPLLPADQTPSLAKRNTDGQTRFRRGFRSFIGAALTGAFDQRDIYREVCAQINFLRQAGVNILHLDTHKHAHVFPTVFRPLLRAAVDCGVRAVRNPFEPARAVTWTGLRTRRSLWSRYLPVRMLQTFARQFNSECGKLGIATPQGTLGVTLTGFADQESFLDLLNRVPEGTWELLCHPAVEDDLWLSLGARPGSGARELKLLLSRSTRACITDNRISLVSYSEFLASRQVAATVPNAA